MLSKTLERDIRSLWDAFWSGGIANPLTAIEQITYLIFLKRLEVMDDEQADDQTSIFRGYWDEEKRESVENKDKGDDKKLIDKSTFRWSNILQMESQDRLRHMQIVFDWLKTLPGAQDRLRDAVFIIPSATLLQKAVSTIDDLFVPSRNYDTLGDIYEYLLSEIAESGKNGQFRTPRHIIRAMIDMVDPKFGELICDPACGTGGFLVNAYLHILKENTNEENLRFEADGTPINTTGESLYFRDGEILTHEELGFEKYFFGFDFDRTMVRLAWMNLIQHGIKEPQMNYADTLGSRFNEELVRGEVGGYDVILANPPFTGSIDKNDIGDTLQSLGSTKTELLFVELIIQLLNTGGRAAVIVPEGLLFGSTRAHVSLRRKLVEENQLNAVISLPGGVFQPYTGVKTSILVFNKGGRTENVWFYEIQSDGYSLASKRDPRPEDNDLWDMVLKYRLRLNAEKPSFTTEQIWHNWKETLEEKLANFYLSPILGVEQFSVGESNVDTIMLQGFNKPEKLAESRSWVASVKDIAGNDFNLSAGRYKPFSLEIKEFDEPANIIRQLQDIESEIQGRLSKLLEMVDGTTHD